MEDTLDLQEIRKAQSELNDAFNFRRSINTDEAATAFDKTDFMENIESATATATVASSAVVGGDNTATASDGSTVAVEEGVTPKKKKRLVRRKKKKVVDEEEAAAAAAAAAAAEDFEVPRDEDILKEYPDLDMLDAELPPTSSAEASASASTSTSTLSEEEKLRAQRLERLGGASSSSSSSSSSEPSTGEPDWFTTSEEDVASAVLDQPNGNAPRDPALEQYESTRFQSQLSAEDWNKQIIDNEDELAPSKYYTRESVCVLVYG